MVQATQKKIFIEDHSLRKSEFRIIIMLGNTAVECSHESGQQLSLQLDLQVEGRQRTKTLASEQFPPLVHTYSNKKTSHNHYQIVSSTEDQVFKYINLLGIEWNNLTQTNTSSHETQEPIFTDKGIQINCGKKTITL